MNLDNSEKMAYCKLIMYAEVQVWEQHIWSYMHFAKFTNTRAIHDWMIPIEHVELLFFKRSI